MSKNTLSRRSALTALAAVTASPVLASTGAASNPWAPTELGLDIMNRLMPAHAAAVHADCNTVDCPSAPEYDAEKAAAVDEAYEETYSRLEEACEAIMDRPVTLLSHLTDLAIAYCALEIEGQGENADDVASVMIDAILDLAGIQIQREPWLEALYNEIDAGVAHG